MPISTFVLGELARSGPLHGLELRRRLEGAGIVSWGPVAATSIYRALAGLERKGLVRRVPGRFHRNQKPFEISPEGRAELVKRLEAELSAPRTYRNPLNIAVEFAPLLGKSRFRAVMEARLAALRAIEASVAEGLGGKSPEEVPEPGAVVAAFERILGKARAETRFAERMLALAKG
ncbi:MAG: PadR family transcriptional regulator [Spirochaetaceae bacterium]|nr:PadR family transcriptional regulator [Spirochaetaceae bacterium]